ncbi:MAG: hypothetical protein ABR543_12670 [Gemmatimonadaceae bacterium]
MRLLSDLRSIPTLAVMLALRASVLDAQSAPELGQIPLGSTTAVPAAHVLPAAVSFAIVASPTVPVSELTMGDLRNVFFFRKKFWGGGKRVVLLLPAPGLQARDFLLADIYRLNSAGLQRLILEKLFQGEIDLAPRVVRSDQDALSFVASARGMLAIVPTDAIPADRSGFKVLRINGKLPGESGYPLTGNP